MFSICRKAVLGMLVMVFFVSHRLHAQHNQMTDSLKVHQLKEVVLRGPRLQMSKNSQSVLGSLDQYLSQAPGLAMLKRGAYAWEPQLFGLGPERMNLTIDGMKIYGACTDKMDPVTSYVSISNIQKVQVATAQEGSLFGPAIAGGVNLSVDQIAYGNSSPHLSLSSGFQSNASAKQLEGSFKKQTDQYFMSLNFSTQKAQNYAAGSRGANTQKQEVLYSQYEKKNAAFQLGALFGTDESVEALYIYDRATDVGYPALPMDVSLALAHMGSLSYKKGRWRSLNDVMFKAYANSIVHQMDDSQRPEVPIRMDMPGWNRTLGFLTEAALNKAKQNWFFKLEGHYNFAEANMTMYPNDPKEKEMFMLTWPLVKTYQLGAYIAHKYEWQPGNYLNTSWRTTWQHQGISSDMGLESLRIFYPSMPAYNTNLFHNVSVGYERQTSALGAQFKIGYGERPLSVSEAYGFYLFNSFDNHDYVGNPEISKEVAWSGQLELNRFFNTHELKASLNAFYFPSFVMGVIDPQLQQMTIGAAGVKRYEALPHAFLYELSMEDKWVVSSAAQLGIQLRYSRGQFYQGASLPFIAPFSYEMYLNHSLFGGLLHLNMKGAATQSHFNALAGEDATPAYVVFNTFYKKEVSFNTKASSLLTLSFQLGVENIFDQYYSTHLDWNNLPRMGRNIIMNTSLNF